MSFSSAGSNLTGYFLFSLFTANETSGSEDDENYVSRSALKRQSERHRR